MRKEKGKQLNRTKTGSSRVIPSANLRELFSLNESSREFPFPLPHRCFRCNAFVALLARVKDTFTVRPFLGVTCVAAIAVVEAMVRAVLLTHGLNDYRGRVLQDNNDFRRMIMNLSSVQAGRFEVRILFCQDGTPISCRETAEKREREPGANHAAYWRRVLQAVDGRLTTRFIDYSFDAVFEQNENTRVQLLKSADMFYCRGTG